MAHGWFPGHAPLAQILSIKATPTSPTTVQIRAVVNSGGVPATLHLDRGVSAGAYHPTQESTPFTVPMTVTWKPSALAPGTTYHFRIVLTGGGVRTYSVEQTFTTDSIVVVSPTSSSRL